MESNLTVLVLARAGGRLIGLDADLRWVDMAHDPSAGGTDVNLFDVVSVGVDGAGLQKLRGSKREVLLSEKFRGLFKNAGELFAASEPAPSPHETVPTPRPSGGYGCAKPSEFSPVLIHVQDMKIYKSGDVFRCDFSHGGVPYQDIGMTDNGFYIDGYEVPDAAAVLLPDEKLITAIAPKTEVRRAIDLADVRTNAGRSRADGEDSESMTSRMAEIEARMAALYDAAHEYDRLKAELVALIKENNGDLKHTYEGGFFKAVYTPPGIRRTIDSDKLKEAGLYESFIKESKTSPSVRIVKIEK